MRIALLVVTLAVFVAGSGSTFAASQHRVRTKTAAAASHAKTKAHAAPARTGKRSAVPHSRNLSRSRKASASAPSRKLGSLRRNVSLARPRVHRGFVAQSAPAAPAPERETRSRAADATTTPVAAAQPHATRPVDTTAIPTVAKSAAVPTHTDAPSAVSSIPLHAPIVAMAPLRGSMESLVRQNEKTDADNLERIENDTDLNDRIAQGVLVPVPASGRLVVNPGLPQNRRYCRPWTASFLGDLARAHDAEFHRPFIVSSAVRTVDYQKHLMRTNGNAAAAEGDVASPHLTGATIDIAKKGMSRQELYWMRNRLDALQDDGKIDVEEEFKQACFHITVYKSYIGAGPVHKHHRATTPTDHADNPDAPVGQPAEGE
ncbi:MAG: DUF5715 family protein [Terracidiphilus sp.]|nr:DUF5715 family protein [Terracidiphilus sp.]